MFRKLIKNKKYRKILYVILIILALGLVAHIAKPLDATDRSMLRLVEKSIKSDEKRNYIDEAHQIGHMIAMKNGKNLLKDLKKCGSPEDLYGACFHGVVMGYSDKLDFKNIGTQCISEENSYLIKRNCTHGLGHAIYKNSLALDLEKCTTYFNNDVVQDCYSGVIMEYMLGTHSKAMGATTSLDVKFPKCYEISSKFLDTCAKAVGSYGLYYVGSNINKTVLECVSMVDDTKYVCLQAASQRMEYASKSKQKDFCRAIESADAKFKHELCN